MKGSLENPPGGLLVWLVVSFEVLVFGAIFVYIGHFARHSHQLFLDGSRQLSVSLGLFYTITLLSSGWLMAQATWWKKNNNAQKALWFYRGSLGVGIIFLFVKGFDFYAKFREGKGLGTNSFWDLYILTTAFHYLHVFSALLIMIGVERSLRKGLDLTPTEGLLASATFWHFCDVIWIFIFSLFYLMRGL